ncbi:hypothetical protein ACFL56_02935 [Candidatus Margulisiibacteriota bacterium]
MLYMDSFFRLMKNDLEKINPDLPEIYYQLHYLIKVSHCTFYEGFTENPGFAANIPDGEAAAIGKSIVRPEFKTNKEKTELIDIKANGSAYGENGLALAHEVMKTIFIMKTRWSMADRAFLTDEERIIHDAFTLSVGAESRQFILGPAVFSLMQKHLEEVDMTFSITDKNLYRLIQNWFYLNPQDFSMLWRFFITGEGDKTFIKSLKNKLLEPLPDEQTEFDQ